MTLENIVAHFNAKRSGKEWKAKCPAHDDHTPSLSIAAGRNGCVLLNCRAGCTLDEILAAIGLTRKDLFPDTLRPYKSQSETVGGRPTPTPPPPFNWRKCVAALTDKHAQQIAKWRGYSVAFVKELRGAGQIGIHNGLVAFPVHNAGKVVGVHYRLKNGKWNYTPGVKAAPLVFGQLLPCERVQVFESTWDALDYLHKSGEREGVICARGASNAKPAAALIPDRATAYVWPQNDKPGADFEAAFVANTKCAVRRVKIPAPHHDLNDWTRNGATVGDLITAMANAETLREPAKIISWRSPDEILAMPRNPKANFFGDRLLGIAQSLVLAGIGGLGKSRLLLQLLVAFILERIWCGIETHHTKGKPWMLVQTQNGISRLQDDLEPLKKFAGDDWPLVNANLFIHTLETDRDLILHLSDPNNAHDLESDIRRRNPIGVAFDPLADVAIGDLSKDVDMNATCQAIGRISRAGNPERAILILTHALTGLAGMKKAFGFEAAGFGRNSKLLQTWSRAFINIIPGTEDYSVLILSCGKCNDGKMFSPFAVRLNPDTMIYEPDPDFDIEGLRDQVTTGKKKKKETFTVDMLREHRFPELELTPLAKCIQDKIGCGRTRSFELVHEARKAKFFRFNKITATYAQN
jgi:hypothetical protein